MKSKKIIVIVIVLFLVTSIGGVMLYINNESNLYSTKISKADIAEATKLKLDNFDVVDSYSKKNNVNSSSRFKFYNELLIAKLNANNADNNDINFITDDFENCNANIDLLDNINNCFYEYNVSWIKDFDNSNITWYKRVQQFEDKNIKSSVTLYFLEVQNSNEYYIILDQTEI